MEKNEMMEIEVEETRPKEKKLEKLFTFTEVVFSIVFAILATLLLYNTFGFSLADHFSIVIRWNTAVVVWGWIMVFILYGVDKLNRKWPKTFNLVLQGILTLALACGLIYFLWLLFQR